MRLLNDDPVLRRKVLAMQTAPGNGQEWKWRLLDAAAYEVARLREEKKRLDAAIRWALGEVGEFSEEPPLIGGMYPRRYHWRTELRRRAFGDAARSLPGEPKNRGSE